MPNAETDARRVSPAIQHRISHERVPQTSRAAHGTAARANGANDLAQRRFLREERRQLPEHSLKTLAGHHTQTKLYDHVQRECLREESRQVRSRI
jgi:hypothetical protein